MQKYNFKILLHDIRSVQNVASIFRLADCIGASEIILSGITPGPIDRFSRTREDFAKISLNSENNIKWSRVGQEIQSEIYARSTNAENLKAVIDFINNFRNINKDNIVIALEQESNSVDYKKIEVDENKNYLIVLGREVEGIDKSILNVCDLIAEIPQYGSKESLNIFSAASIALYRWFDF